MKISAVIVKYATAPYALIASTFVAFARRFCGYNFLLHSASFLATSIFIKYPVY